MKFKLMLLLFCILIATTGIASDIVINEIMYNNPGSDVEFIELFNNSNTSIDLQNWYILDDNDSHSPCTLQGTMAPGDYFIIAGDISLFQTKYPHVQNVNLNEYDSGANAWSLGNGGDAVRLFESTGTLHDIVTYSDGGDWPGSPDADGPSLELLHPGLDNALPTSWDPSNMDDGTPGTQNSVYTENVAPTCKDGDRLIDLPSSSDDVTVTVLAYDNEGFEKVELMVNTDSGYSPLRMNDAGIDGDEKAGDSLYTVQIPAQSSGTLVKYYALATDDIGQTDTWPNGAPDDYRAYTVDYSLPQLRITEVLAVNNTTNVDGAGEYDDWFELHNEGDETVNLAGMYVSSALNSTMEFELPDKNLAPDEYLIIWADNDITQGSFHTDFKLSSGGESVAIFETIDHGNVMIHGWKYGIMSADVSIGFKPNNGTAPEYLQTPTPGASNENSELFSPVCINEFQSTSAFGGPEDDWIEIYNRSDESFDLSGAFLTDNRSNVTKWQFPVGVESVLEPDEFLVIYEDVLKFGFSSDGSDVIMLTAADTTTGLDFYDFGVQTADVSEGRYPDGNGIWQFFESPTRGTANMPTGINDPENVASSDKVSLFQNYPNPFNGETMIRYTLPFSAQVHIQIFNIQGERIDSFAFQNQLAGSHILLWDGTNYLNQPVSSGIYFYRLEAEHGGKHFHATQKMLMVK